VITDIRPGSDAEKTLADAKALGVRAMFVEADVSKDASISGAIQKAAADFGRLDVLVNNAGTTSFVKYTDLDGVTDEIWQRILAVNLIGVFYASRAAAKIMLPQGGGCIVNVASGAARDALGSSIPYTVSKAGVVSLTQTLARTLAPTIRVNAVSPGVVDTRWHDGHEENKTNFAKRSLLGRVSTPADIAEVIVALVTSAGFVTGQYVAVDGGATIF
jgi:3-oxoacyl-[acyl-carrier protein] reductase